MEWNDPVPYLVGSDGMKRSGFVFLVLEWKKNGAGRSRWSERMAVMLCSAWHAGGEADKSMVTPTMARTTERAARTSPTGIALFRGVGDCRAGSVGVALLAGNEVS
jgi:hypothetical protein